MGLFTRRRISKSTVSILENNTIMRSFVSRTIFNIPEIRTAINKISETFATMPIWRKRITRSTGEVEYINDRTDYILNISPNPIQAKTQFWNYIINKLLLNNSVAIEMMYDDAGLRYLMPLPYYKSVPQNDLSTVIFNDDMEQKVYKLANIILLTRFDEFGKGANTQATDLYDQVISAIQSRALKNTEDGKRIVAVVKKNMVQVSSRVKSGDKVNTIDDIATQMSDSKLEGFAYLDGATEIIPMHIPDIKVEKELLATIVEATYNYFGVSKYIIDGTASEIQYEQFIMGVIKYLACQCGEEFTRKIFTEREIQFGNSIEFDHLELQISSIHSKVALMNNGILNGYLNQDECREKIGLPPLPDGLGKTYRGNLNSANLDMIDDYQINKATQNGGFVSNEK